MGLVQHASNTVTSGSSISATFGSNTTSGNTIVVCVSNESSRTVSSVALTGSSDTFAKAVSAGTTDECEIWYDSSNSGGHTVVTVTFSSTVTAAQVDVYEWNGISPSTPVDKTHTGTGTSSSWSSGATATLSQAAEVAFAVVCCAGASITITGPSSPWTNESQLVTTNDGQLSGYQQVSATTALTYSGSFSGTFPYTACIATFKLGGATGSGAPLMMVFP